MTTGEIQQALFQAIKSKLSEGMSVVDETAKLLEISTDSAYRRMRGEKTVTIDEFRILCVHFGLSADELLGFRKEGVVFKGSYVDNVNFNFKEYIRSVGQNLAFMNRHKEKCFYYMCKDLPIFYHYHLKEIAAFKWFFWLNTYLQFPGFERKKFRVEDHPADIFELENEVLEQYNQIPSVEVWNIENMNIFLRQIDFYRDAQLFESDEEIYKLYDAISRLWNHLEKQASLGYKFRMDDPEKKTGRRIENVFQ